MQPIKRLTNWLDQYTDSAHCLFTPQDFRALFPDLSDAAFKTLLSRAVESGHLSRACRGIYMSSRVSSNTGLQLFHVASLLRSNHFNYVSLETTLSDQGVISQIPLNWITLMSSGRSNIISCGNLGNIEFIHTAQKPVEIMDQLFYDQARGLWQANVKLAIRDMKAAKRDMELIDWDIANELI